MSLLLPQQRTGTVRATRTVDLHGDRWLDLLVAFDGDAGATALRVAFDACPADLAVDDRVAVRLVMGTATRVERA